MADIKNVNGTPEQSEDPNLLNINRALEYDINGNPVIRVVNQSSTPVVTASNVVNNYNLAAGQLTGVERIIVGGTGFVGRGSTPIFTLWDGPDTSSSPAEDLYTYIDTPSKITIVSDDDRDDENPNTAVNPDGAWKIRVTGIIANGSIDTEEIALNGGIPVVTTLEFTRLLKATIIETGLSNTLNLGTITLTSDVATGSVLMGQIVPDRGQTRSSMYSIPTDYTGYIINWTTGNGPDHTSSAYVQLCVRATPGSVSPFEPFLPVDQLMMQSTTISKDYIVPIRVPEGADIEIRVNYEGGSNFGQVSSSYTLILIHRDVAATLVP